jgi:glutathione synthase/RimK-type ligase-like ATP-grasp enzyme
LPDTLALAQRVQAAFPEVALLGVDIVRDFSSGQLYIIEVNSAGLCWHFSSEAGLRVQREFGLSLEAQFDGRRRAAKVLVENTLKLAK